MNVKYFSLNLEALSPLAIRSDHAPGGADSAGYISGTALAGSLAAVYRLYHQQGSTNFERLFLSGQVQYPDMYPAFFKSGEVQKASNLPVYPVPKTAQTCKRFPGFRHIFRGEKLDDPRHGVRDALLDWAMFELGSKADAPIKTDTLLAPLRSHKDCDYATSDKKCGKPMERFTGYYRRIGEHMMHASADTRLQMHTGINRDTGTVQEGILYSRRVFEEHSRFWGMIKLLPELVDPFEDFIKEVGQSGLVRIGTGRSRGSGKVSLSVEEIKPVEVEEQRFDRFKSRLEEFNTALRDKVEQALSAIPLKPFYFALTLHSPAILCDDLLRYHSTINEKTLVRLLKMPEDSAAMFKLVYQAASARRMTGWNELWGTPRTNEYAIDTGSVFLFAFDKEPENSLWRALFDLEEASIGRRRSEGFGRVCISDRFHLEVELQ